MDRFRDRCPGSEGDYFEVRATKLPAEVGRPELSTLRVFDVMLWV